MTKWLVIATFALILGCVGLVASFDPFAWETEDEVTVTLACPNGALVWGKEEIAYSSIVGRGEDEDGEWITIAFVPGDWSQLMEFSRQSIGDECHLFAGRIRVISFVIEQVIWEGPLYLTMRHIDYAERLVKELN